MPRLEPAGVRAAEPQDELTAASAAAARLLPRVLPETPAAVLLIDTPRNEVVYASPVAQQLAPDLALPFGLDAWATAAQLQDTDARALNGTASPLADLAAGRHPQGKIVSALRASDISLGRELLWVAGVPLADAPVLDQFSLLILLPLRDTEAIETAMAVAGSEAEIRDRAVLATGLSFTVADAVAQGQPLIWVNPAFTAATGYTFEDAVGKNCRFLQGRETDPQAHVLIRRALDAGSDLVFTLLNYKKDGTPFWNQLSINPIRDCTGAVTHFVGIQTDVTQSRAVELEREQALLAERTARRAAEQAQHAAEQATLEAVQARAEAERARAAAERAVSEAQVVRKRLSLLVEATTQLAATLDLDEALERLITLVVPLMADWIIIDIPGTVGLARRVIIRDSAGRTDITALLTDFVAAGVGSNTMTGEVAETGRAVLRTDITSELIASTYPVEMHEAVTALGMTAGMAVPLRARNRMLGVITLIADGSGRTFDTEDLSVAADLGRRAALTLDNARLYQIEHQNAETLQRSLLPDLPDVAGIATAARYLAGASSAEVGGDFYELLDLPDGSVGVAIGDVVGHDMAAAAAMGHLRGLLRACAWDTSESGADGGAPGTVVRRVDRLVQGLHVAPLATVFYGRLERPSQSSRRGTASWVMTYNNAGHPPPVIRRPDGTAYVVDTEPGMLLGVDGSSRETLRLDLPAGSTLFTYTDGLIERRGSDITEGLEWLRALIETAPTGATPEELVDLATRDLKGVDDDVAVLAVMILP